MALIEPVAPADAVAQPPAPAEPDASVVAAALDVVLVDVAVPVLLFPQAANATAAAVSPTISRRLRARRTMISLCSPMGLPTR
ncbi:MAG: hypothetical protein ABJA16_05835 [Nakamurella sp.]